MQLVESSRGILLHLEADRRAQEIEGQGSYLTGWAAGRQVQEEHTDAAPGGVGAETSASLKRHTSAGKIRPQSVPYGILTLLAPPNDASFHYRALDTCAREGRRYGICKGEPVC